MHFRLFDCFTFYDEFDVLELRLKELANIVHRFVLVEGTRTFSGQPKPLFFMENRERFRPYLDKIEHVILNDSDFPAGPVTAWEREYFSRRAILRGLARAKPDDFVLVADVDEIPKPELLSNTLASPAAARQFTVFESSCYVYFFNLKASQRGPSLVQAPRLLKRRYLRDPQAVRSFRPRISKRRSIALIEPVVQKVRAWSRFGHPLKVVIMPNSAWHFTYSGGPEHVRAKILAYSHTEKARPEIVEAGAIERAVTSHSYIFNPSEKFEEIPLGYELPKALRDDPLRWKAALTEGCVKALLDSAQQAETSQPQSHLPEPNSSIVATR
jgi:beta-1,4-mannosyl-glycoprotein beta-1,4-N-acetylglucosaminyltransferase